MAYVFRIAKAGYDVLTETDGKNFIFNSDYNHLKTAGYGSFQQLVNKFSSVTVTVAHGLNIYPLCIAYWRDTTTTDWFITSTQYYGGQLGLFNDFNVSLKIDQTNLYFDCFHNNSSAPASVTFEVLYEYFYEGL